MADRIERLTNLIALLLETREPLSLVEIASELAGQYSDRHDARRAAFERDKAALRSIGVPIETEVVVGGAYAGQTRYWIDRHKYELGDLDLEPDELRALQVAIATVRTGDTLGEQALLKVVAGSGTSEPPDGAASSPGTVPGVTRGVSAFVPTVVDLPALRDAVTSRSTVEFSYRGVERRLEPWGVLLRDGFWYVIGRDLERDEQRVFRVDRIEAGSLVVGDAGAFTRPPGFQPRSAFPSDPKLFGANDDGRADAVVRIDAVRSAAVTREVGDDRIVARHADGSTDVRVPATNRAAFRSWVLGLGVHAAVLEPAEIRADVINWLEQIVEANS